MATPQARWLADPRSVIQQNNLAVRELKRIVMDVRSFLLVAH
jgi:hypothetical protein